MSRADRIKKVIEAIRPIKPVVIKKFFTTNDGKIYEITDDKSFFEISEEQLNEHKKDDGLIIMMEFEDTDELTELWFPNLK